uniref:Uncharacterized protein n=1 Tax=Anguilla anguilla TaxID=7936 RepID=A0A0E9T066_ANGAN
MGRPLCCKPVLRAHIFPQTVL